jgi:hypothetical protein
MKRFAPVGRELFADEIAWDLEPLPAPRPASMNDVTARFEWKDPYRPLAPGAVRVDFCEESYVRGPQR